MYEEEGRHRVYYTGVVSVCCTLYEYNYPQIARYTIPNISQSRNKFKLRKTTKKILNSHALEHRNSLFMDERMLNVWGFLSLQVYDENDVRRARFVGRQKEVTLLSV